MRWLLSIACSLVPVLLSAQETPGPDLEQEFENLAQVTDEAEIKDDSWLQDLDYLKEHSLDLNACEEDDLRGLRLLDPLQIRHFLDYRNLLGKFLNIYELQAIPYWDLQTIQKILPFVIVRDASWNAVPLFKRLSRGSFNAMVRTSTILERSNRYTIDSGSSGFLGDPFSVMTRLKYSYKNLLQYGITADKDAGEAFFGPRQKAGFDFYSFHLFARNLGLIKAMAIGDFNINFGQGLILWQSLAFNKGGDITQVKRQSPVLRPYNSTGEFNFFRGAAATLRKQSWEATGFLSCRRLDGNSMTDTAGSGTVISSILNAGYHRTPGELADKSELILLASGLNLMYKRDSWRLSANAVHYNLNQPIRKRDLPYNLFAISGDTWSNFSLDYAYTFNNMHFFGEAAIDKNRNPAVTNGMLISLDPLADLSLVYRNISRAYQSFYGNAFTERGSPNNERGLYIGFCLRPTIKWKIDAYADFFNFPWLVYGADAPSIGNDYLLRLSYEPDKILEIITTFRSSGKIVNISSGDLPGHDLGESGRTSWRFQLNYHLSRTISLRYRCELLYYGQGRARVNKGYLTYFDFFYKPFPKPFSLNFRLQYFDTRSYDSRVYTFENDVLYFNAISAFYGQGSRYYINFRYQPRKSWSLWLKWGQSLYRNADEIGSGPDTIYGNKKSECRLLLSVNF